MMIMMIMVMMTITMRKPMTVDNDYDGYGNDDGHDEKANDR